ncbi:hypothetical protein AAVH_20441 [Aphelenchoides avenae]|nr:hypothetical protein AAVH_20441 [Aphelenchus avenae]
MDADRARLRQSLEKAQRRPSVEAPANCVPCEIRSLEEQIDIANCGRQYLKSEVHKIEIIHSDVRTLETTIDEIETDRALIVYDRENWDRLTNPFEEGHPMRRVFLRDLDGHCSKVNDYRHHKECEDDLRNRLRTGKLMNKEEAEV